MGATIGALIGIGVDGEVGMQAGALLGAEAGADGHLIPDSEMYDVADSIAPGSAAALALIEHIWAGPLRSGPQERAEGPSATPGSIPYHLVDIGLIAADELEMI